MYAKTQWRVGFGCLTGLDYPALFAIADRLDFDLSPVAMRKIKMLEEYMLDYSKKEADKIGSK